MGQRHQMFIVARVVPYGNAEKKAYYRCLGAYHHQWCYGSLPLRAADRFLTLVKQPVNAAIIREELKSVQGKYGRHRQEPDIPEIPCPYSIFLLASALNVDLDTNYVHGGPFECSLLPAGMGCWAGDNNDGITILDISDPLNPAYAFAFRSNPLAARDYLRRYYKIGSGEEGDEERLELVSRFHSVPVLTLEALTQAWPNAFGIADPASTESIPESVPDAAPSVVAVPALSDLVIEPAVARSLEFGNTDEIELMIPSKLLQIKDLLRARNSFPDTGLPLLKALLYQELREEVGALDLTGFSLSPEQLASVVSEFESTRIVILSHSSEVKIDHVRALLSVKPEIDRLDLLDTGITNEGFFSLLDDHPELFMRVSDVAHLHLVSAKHHTNPGCFHVFASQPRSNLFYGDMNNFEDYIRGSIQAIPFWTPAKVVRNIIDFLTMIVSPRDIFKAIDCLQSMMVPAAMSAGLRKSGIPWKDRPVTMVTQDVQKLHANGWSFLLIEGNPLSNSPPPNDYAFAKILPGGGVQTYDIEGFLEKMEEEGRGPLPTPDIVREFQGLAARATDTSTTLTLLNNAAALKFMVDLLPPSKIDARTVLQRQQPTE